MKDVQPLLLSLLRGGYCTPHIARIAKKTGVPSTTLHYNLRKLEKDGVIRTYAAVIDPKGAGQRFTAFVLLTLAPDEYENPEQIASELARHDEVESVDIITGDWEAIIKVHTVDMEAFYAFIKNVLSRKGITKIKTLSSLKAVKSQFVRQEKT